MSSFFPSTFLSASALEVALLFFVGGMIILLRSLHTQDQQIGEQKLAIAELGEQLQNCVTQQQAVQEQLSGLHEQSLSLNARQQLVEKHGSDVQRIDLAMRMLKRGVGNAETLHDLGLSSSEIKLLLRLHSNPKGQNVVPPRVEKVVQPGVSLKHRPVPEPLAASVNTVDEVVSDTPEQVSENVPQQASEQGQELAKLFKVHAVS